MAKVYDTATDIITFARGSSATYLDSDGVLKTAATDAPRIEYAEDGTLKGLLIEEQRTNLLHNTDNPPTQVANLTAGSHTLSFVGGPSTQTISDSITANAVDVFVYDTKRDSDGGAWRTGSLAQASSWYAEASSASRDPNTRSTRAEFPEVAVIVAEFSKVTIYDGDDPSLPMWMVFNNSGTSGQERTFWAANQDCSSVAAANGVLAFGVNEVSVSSGACLIHFIADNLQRFGTTSSWGGVYTGIVDRNSDPTLAGTVVPIVYTVVNDVAMTVLPDAPTDPATGLPVPTIAVATDGGVSVIKDDGTVVDVTGSGSFSGVTFFEDNRVGAYQLATKDITTYSIPTANASVNSSGVFSGGVSDGKYYRENFVPAVMATSSYSYGQTEFFPTGAGDDLVFAWREISGSEGFGVLKEAPVQANGMVSKTTSSYNTGWLPGDIKLAALANSATADRSVNNNPLTQYGTITATPVATGADVVAYSGFSGSNYLEQPYNADLDFGTGDFCVMGWVTYKSGINNFIIDRTNGAASSTDRWNFGLSASGLFQRCDSTFISVSHTFVDGVRYFICGVRTGGVFYAYVDGALVGSAAQAGDQTDASQSYPLTVASFGGSNKGDAPTDIALLRISATAPTADQIAKIYEDEKLLFQPNAKATLDGTSDAVTALAHDPETDLLHVGTNQSRSVFYGLRRINQTGNAVTTAISAVDGLISEQ